MHLSFETLVEAAEKNLIDYSDFIFRLLETTELYTSAQACLQSVQRMTF